MPLQNMRHTSKIRSPSMHIYNFSLSQCIQAILLSLFGMHDTHFAKCHTAHDVSSQYANAFFKSNATLSMCLAIKPTQHNYTLQFKSKSQARLVCTHITCRRQFAQKRYENHSRRIWQRFGHTNEVRVHHMCVLYVCKCIMRRDIH